MVFYLPVLEIDKDNDFKRRMPMKLQDKLDKYKKSFLEKAPADAVETMQRATRELADSGQAEKAVKVGDCAPDFSLENTAGEKVGLAGMLLKGPVVLTFYRGKW